MSSLTKILWTKWHTYVIMSVTCLCMSFCSYDVLRNQNYKINMKNIFFMEKVIYVQWQISEDWNKCNTNRKNNEKLTIYTKKLLQRKKLVTYRRLSLLTTPARMKGARSCFDRLVKAARDTWCGSQLHAWDRQIRITMPMSFCTYFPYYFFPCRRARFLVFSDGQNSFPFFSQIEGQYLVYVSLFLLRPQNMNFLLVRAIP